MNRRGFLMGAGGILACAAAPAIVRADSLMRIVPREVMVVTGMDILIDQSRPSDRTVISVMDPRAKKLFAVALFAEASKKSPGIAEFMRWEGLVDVEGRPFR